MKRPQVTMETCSACNGLGKRPNGSTGAVMRLERESKDLTRAEVVVYFKKPEERGNYSESYLIDLERDSRAWSLAMVASFREAIELAVKARMEEAVTT